MRQSYTQQAAAPLIEVDDFSIERPAITNLKLGILIFSTFGLVIAIYAMSSAIETVKGTFAESYEVGGGIVLALFLVYVIFFGVMWYIGNGKREQLKRDVVQKAILKERALQAKQNLQ